MNTVPNTADVVDDHRDSLHSVDIQLRNYGGRRAFAGIVETLQCLEDNALLKATVSTPGDGRVLVVDGGGSLRSALVGDVIAGLARDNGWGGLIVHGAVRDVDALAGLDIGIKALGSNPFTSAKTGAGVAGVPVRIGLAVFAPGAWVCSDADGIVVRAAGAPGAN